MAYQKLQVSDGLAVIPSATVNIPDPSTQMVTSTTDGTTATKLVDSTQDFIAMGVKAGMIVYNTTDTTAAYVTAVDDANTLSISVDVMATAEAYSIYGSATDGCVLYVGVAGDLVAVLATDKDIAPASQKELTFKNLPNASFLPTQVVRVDDTTTATDIIALW
tara:strand:+ start:131 stop:619 length:489 start_codon:yes stop_codon:yes gene_type:complete